jgi:Ca2+-binding EF-hand superfamily protein
LKGIRYKGRSLSLVYNLFINKRVEMSDIDGIIEKCIDDIWKTYDKDNSGFLDKLETKAFVKNTLTEMGENGEFSEGDFESCFKEFDKDGNGTISRDEMKIFIKKVAGL